MSYYTSVAYEVENYGTIVIDKQCPKCGRFHTLKGIVIFTNWAGLIQITGYICSRYGEIEPDYEWE